MDKLEQTSRNPPQESAEALTKVSRRNWSDNDCALVLDVLDRLAERFRSGQESPLIRPQTLLRLGGDFAALYMVVCARESRADWANQLFPHGFQDLVEQLNKRLEGSGITVADVKRPIARYRKLPLDERKVVHNHVAQVCEGTALEDALTSLRVHYRIELSERQIEYFFGKHRSDKTTQPNSIQSSPEKTMEVRKERLCSVLTSIKESLRLDLSLHDCVKGLAFEAFVGVCLAERFGKEALESQVQMPVVYCDLNGSHHSQVFLDYLVTTHDEKLIFEIKLRNDMKNIMTSVLAQVVALERVTGQEEFVTVVYRHPCPMMKMATDADIRVSHYIDTMNLRGIHSIDRPLSRLLSYVSIEDLLKENSPRGAQIDHLYKLDQVLSTSSTQTLREVIDCLERIAASPDATSTSLTQLFSAVENGDALSPSIAQRLFGKLPTRSDREVSSSERRIRIAEGAMRRNRDALLLDLYEEAFGNRPATLSEEDVTRLENLDKAMLEEAALELLSKKEQRATEALLKRRGSPSQSEQTERVISAYNTVANEKRKQLRQEIEQIIALRSSATYDPIGNLSTIKFPSPEELFNGLERHDIKYRGGFRQFVSDLLDRHILVQQMQARCLQWIQGMYAAIAQQLDKAAPSLHTAHQIHFEIPRKGLKELRDAVHNDLRHAVKKTPLERALMNLGRRMSKGKQASIAAKNALDAYRTNGLEMGFVEKIINVTASQLTCIEDISNISLLDARDAVSMAYTLLHKQLQRSSATDTPGIDYILELPQWEHMIGRKFLTRLYSFDNEELLLNREDILDSETSAAEYLKVSLSCASITQPVLFEPGVVRNGPRLLTSLTDQSIEVRIQPSHQEEYSKAPHSLISKQLHSRLIRQRELCYELSCWVVGNVFLRGSLVQERKDINGSSKAEMAECLNEAVTREPLATCQELDRLGVLTLNLLSDYWERKLRQSTVLAQFDQGLAIEFLTGTIVDLSLSTPYREARKKVLEAVTQNDSLFEALLS